MSDFSFTLAPDAIGYQDYIINSQGRLDLSDGIKPVQDRILTRLYTELGEWYLNITVGVNYYGDNGILGSKMPTDEISAIIKAQILDVDDVVRIDRFHLQNVQRILRIQADVVVTLNGTQQTVQVTLP